MVQESLIKAKQEVLLACKRLTAEGLVSRTWGNISYRVDDKNFVITPSGKSYDILDEDMLVKVNINDLSYEGSLKPSSEKGIHAEVYKKFSGINCVIHTHQTFGTAFSIAGSALLNAYLDNEESPFQKVLVADYGLPGTKTLCHKVKEKLDINSIILMERHGALVFGENVDEAFNKAEYLEKIAIQRIEKLTSENHEISFIRLMYENICVDKYFRSDENIDNDIVKKIFSIDKKVNVIYKLTGGIIDRYINRRHRPMLDDFDQIIGTSVNTVSRANDLVFRKIRNRNMVFVKDKYALCFAVNEQDAEAQKYIAVKEFITAYNAEINGIYEPLSLADRVVMRMVYMRKYSKLNK